MRKCVRACMCVCVHACVHVVRPVFCTELCHRGIAGEKNL